MGFLSAGGVFTVSHTRGQRRSTRMSSPEYGAYVAVAGVVVQSSDGDGDTYARGMAIPAMRRMTQVITETTRYDPDVFRVPGGGIRPSEENETIVEIVDNMGNIIAKFAEI